MTEDPKIAHEMRVTRCRSCQGRIVWLKTAAGRDMPTDAETVLPEDTQYSSAKHRSHWGTCPTSDQHRKQKDGR